MSVSENFQSFFVRALERNLPRRTKRLIFLASFSARMIEDEPSALDHPQEPKFDSATLEKLNRLMVLSANDSALKFPVHLSKVIWNGQTLTDICQDDFSHGTFTLQRVELASEQIVNKMPGWLRYGRRADILNDVKKLLTNRKELLTPQQATA